MALLSVRTTDRSSVLVHSDAVLFLRPTGYGGHGGGGFSRYTQPAQIAAMSIIGPEQAVRSIQAGCSRENEYTRMELSFTGAPKNVITGRWLGPWNCKACLLATGAMHMVAIPKVTIAQVADSDTARYQDHVVIPEDASSDAAIRRAIYQRLLLVYTTPLIPLEVRGQSPAEREAGTHWCDAIVSHIMRNREWWQTLALHPDQPDRRWSGSGILSISEPELDDLVCSLVRAKQIAIPAVHSPLPAELAAGAA